MMPAPRPASGGHGTPRCSGARPCVRARESGLRLGRVKLTSRGARAKDLTTGGAHLLSTRPPLDSRAGWEINEGRTP
jgi:hypothetical protein